MKKDLYIVRKYIYAKDAQEAIKIEKDFPVQDVWIHETWLNEQIVNKVGSLPDKKGKDCGFKK